MTDQCVVRWSVGVAAGLVATVCSRGAMASVTVFDGPSAAWEWTAATGGSATTIGFTGFADGTEVTDQFASQGVVFTQPGHVVNVTDPQPASALVSVNGSFVGSPVAASDGIRANFDALMHALGLGVQASYGLVLVTLYREGAVVWAGQVGPLFNPLPTWYPPPFMGLVSDEGFDAVWISASNQPGDFPGNAHHSLAVESFAFSTVPGPGSIGMLLAALAAPRRRR